MQQVDVSGDNLPLSEATFCILLSLVAGPRHGYAIMQEVEALSNGRVRLSTGTLYGGLKRLLDQGWIVPAPGATSTARSRDVRVYELTEQGRQIFRAEQERMRAMVRLATERLSGDRI
jgi:DNA-binding PadR family transcriptional regulator